MVINSIFLTNYNQIQNCLLSVASICLEHWVSKFLSASLHPFSTLSFPSLYFSPFLPPLPCLPPILSPPSLAALFQSSIPSLSVPLTQGSSPGRFWEDTWTSYSYNKWLGNHSLKANYYVNQLLSSFYTCIKISVMLEARRTRMHQSFNFVRKFKLRLLTTCFSARFVKKEVWERPSLSLLLPPLPSLLPFLSLPSPLSPLSSSPLPCPSPPLRSTPLPSPPPPPPPLVNGGPGVSPPEKILKI
jgi:hypothetical protein